MPIPANSLLTISLTGIGLVCKGAAPLVFSLPSNAASGSVVAVAHALETVLQVSFATSFSTGIPIQFSVSPVYSECFASVSNISAALFDKDGGMLSATMSSSFYATTTRLTATIRQLIAQASNGVIHIPEGTYAGKCNCNNTIDASVPARSVGVAVQIKGAEGTPIIDCSGTGMRCLIVRLSSLVITNIIFKGGSSPTFVSSAMLSAIEDLFDAENPNFERKRRATASVLSASHAASNIADFSKTKTPEFPMLSVAEEGAGGCVFIVAPSSSVSLSGVLFFNCSAVFGAAGFFNVSFFQRPKEKPKAMSRGKVAVYLSRHQ
jgi:hypothetical protein